MKTETILRALNELHDLDDAAQMQALMNALDRLGEQLPSEPAVTEALFGVLERFPESDGYGTFWTILHILEDTPHYESALLRSVRRQPNEFTVLMLNRLWNAEVATIGETKILDLLREVVANPRTPAEIGELARELRAEKS